MKYLFSLGLLLMLNSAFGQHIQWTLKPGAAANQADVYLRPTFNFNPGAATPFEYFGQVQFAIGWQTSCPTAGQPTVSFTIDPAFNTQGGGTYTVNVFPRSNSISPAGESYNVVYLERTGSSGAQTYNALVEVKVGTVTFTGSAPFCPIKIVDYEDAGADGQASCFATNSRTGEFLRAGPGYAPGVSSDNFYTSPGNSLAGGNATSGYAQLIQLTSLPLKLTSFTAAADNCAALLDWETAEEVSVSYFDIEESADGINYKKTGTVKALGSALVNKYHFRVNDNKGIRYYRLRMVDNDGGYSFSPVRIVTGDCGGAGSFSVYPNPVRTVGDVLTLRYSMPQAGAVQVVLYNATGQQVLARTLNATAGINQQQLQLPTVSKGAYYLKLTNKEGSEIGAQQLIVK